ncbi:GGDEF domain-containing protein [Vibrio salinus]|uniref:GGDEF domain-containing protein n=1 Tax=Vibrio salinus TaxID=2899784 RepID=UPI001E514C40|nr:GGDEF domain-containing protein [Vibrio salinus]MCE0494687.1 transporter substrate-binding domain-containing protein [Vibrio salinus]
MKKAILVLISLFWLTTIGSNAQARDETQASPTYRIGIEADDVTTRVLFNSAAYHFDFNVQYVRYPSFDAILKAIETGDADFAANVTFTQERAKRFEISRPTNIEYTYMFSKHGARLDDISSIGVPEGTIYGQLIRDHYPQMKQISYLGHDAAVTLLRSGAVDGVIDAINQLKPMLFKGFEAEILNDQLPIKPVSIIAPSGKHSELLKKIQQYAYSADLQRMLSSSIKKYQLDIRKQALRLAVRESGLDMQRIYRVKLEDLSEYTIYHKNGDVDGISADVVFQACKMLMIKCDLLSQSGESWENMYSELLQKKIDILSPTIISERRKKHMYFSDPYYFPEVVLIKRENYKNNVYSNISELITERIGVIKDDFFDTLLTRMLPNKVLYRFSSQKKQIQALLDKKVDYIVLSRINYNHLLRNSDTVFPIQEDTLIGNFYKSKVAIAFPKNEEGRLLAPLFSRAIHMIDMSKIITKYNVLPDWRATLIAEKRFNRHSLWFLFGLLLALAVVAYYLHIQALTDNLTKLKNRRALYRKYVRGISSRHTVVYLDVNRFKPINDTFGHEVGDKVLMRLAERIMAHWKGTGYRIGGDEFILVGDSKGEELLESIANFERFVFIDSDRNLSFTVTVAVGISQNREQQYMDLEDVLHHTDIEMYRSKYKSRSFKSASIDMSEPDQEQKWA